MGKLGTILFITVNLSYIGFAIVIFIDILSKDLYAPFYSVYTFTPFICLNGIIGNFTRAFMTKTISKAAANSDYNQYKKRIVKNTSIITIICSVIIVCLIMATYFLENVLFSGIIIVLLLVIMGSLLSCFLMLRAKKSYDKEANIYDTLDQ